MQPTNLQVRRSLEALERVPATDEPAVSPDLSASLSVDDLDLCTEMVAELGDGPVIRSDRLEEARQRLEARDQPTAGDLADRMVGRLVCDRLR